MAGDVELRNSARALRIGLRITADGRVQLIIPAGCGEGEAVRFMESKIGWIHRTLQRVALRRTLHEPALRRDMTPEEQRRRIELLREQARNDLPQRIERLARQTGLGYSRLTLRAVKSKWGSCSPTNAISLNIFLMILPEHLRDFVIIHELCHTVEHNHSPRFHALVNRHTQGREREWERELRTYTIIG